MPPFCPVCIPLLPPPEPTPTATDAAGWINHAPQPRNLTVPPPLACPRYQWGHIVIDEGHRLKDASCKLAVELGFYQSRSRLLLTGGSIRIKIRARVSHWGTRGTGNRGLDGGTSWKGIPCLTVTPQAQRPPLPLLSLLPRCWRWPYPGTTGACVAHAADAWDHCSG